MKHLVRLIAVLLVLAGLLGPGRDVPAFAFWWLTNGEAPQVALAAPPGAVRGTVEIPVEVQPSGRADLVAAELGGRSVALGPILRLETVGLPDGEHQLAVKARDRSLRGNQSDVSLRLVIDNTPPQLEILPTPTAVPQGHTLVVSIRSNEPADIKLSLAGQTLPVFQNGGDYWSVVGIGPDASVGELDVVAEATDRVGNASRVDARVAIKPFEFTRDQLVVAADMLPLLQPAVRAAEDQRLTTIYGRDNGPPLWRAPFQKPVNGPISTEFGEIRSYNGGPFAGHHGGTDFQVAMDTPVLAPARGRVALKEEVRLRGKILVLDHGGGVYTTYAHLNDWMVEPGQEVEAGQPVAKVGSTGLSTGPHLHWELWVAGRSVNPMEWIERAIP